MTFHLHGLKVVLLGTQDLTNGREKRTSVGCEVGSTDREQDIGAERESLAVWGEAVDGDLPAKALIKFRERRLDLALARSEALVDVCLRKRSEMLH
jgi:hypothetical protein